MVKRGKKTKYLFVTGGVVSSLGKGLAAASIGASPLQVALAWLLQRSPNILLIPGTSSLKHLRENLAARTLTLTPELVAQLDGIARRKAPGAA